MGLCKEMDKYNFVYIIIIKKTNGLGFKSLELNNLSKEWKLNALFNILYQDEALEML